MAEYITKKQSNQGWNLSWSALDRYPMIAKRRFKTLADAQAFVDDVAPGASATEGLILAVINDPVAKNNGVYYVQSVANTDPEYGKLLDKGTLVKVGGTETETAENYSAAKTLSQTLVVGQLIKVANAEEIEETVDGEVVKNTYQAGFYIVEGAGVISALATSTGSDDEVGALKTRVAAVETGKVDKVEGSRLMTDAEGTKLAGIAEGAEVNYVKSVGDNLTVDADGRLTVDMSSKVNKSDYDTKIGEINGTLAGKADAQTVADHIANTNIHVTIEEKGVWNNAEKNAKEYADSLNTTMNTRMTTVEGKVEVLEAIDHDAYKSADEALETKLQGKIDAKADASTLENYLLKSDKYDDTAVRNLITAESEAREALATTLRGELADEVETLEGAIAAETTARGELASALRGEISAAQTAAEKVATDFNTAMNGRMTTVEGKVADLEAIDHEQLMTDAINEWANQVSPDNTTVDTFKELIDYAAAHSSEYSELAGVVQGMTTSKADVSALKALQTLVNNNKTATETAISETNAEVAKKANKSDLEALNAIVGKASVEGGEAGSGLVKRVEDLEAIDHDAYKSADATLKGELQVEINKKADTSALETEVSAREALAALVGARAEGDSEDVFTKLAALVAKNTTQDEEIAKKADKSVVEELAGVVDTKAAQSDLEALAGIVGKESEESGIFAKLKALASKDTEHDNAIAALQALKVNNKAFEDGAVVLDTKDILLGESIVREGEESPVYANNLSIQTVLANLSHRIDVLDPNVSGELGITSIVEGNGVTVSTSGGQATVAAKVVADNFLKVGANGLYVEIAVGGNDSE